MVSTSSNDLAQLEYEFATSPNSEAFIPLAEAYLGMGRFVEAMVVCKKGIKAHPDLPTGRLIMARIYSDQAKHQKAIDELEKLLKLSPDNADAYLLLGNVQLKLGREEQGVGYLKKSLDINPDMSDAREALLKIGIDYTPRSAAQPAAQPAAQQSAAAPMSERPTERQMPVARAPDTQPGEPGALPPSESETERAIPAAQPRPEIQPRPRPAPRQAPRQTPRRRIADIYNDMEERNRKPQRKGIKYTMYMAGVLGVVLIIYVIYTWQAGIKQKKINDNLEKGRAAFNQDTYTGYTKALENYRAIYKLDKKHLEALSRGAFICAVLPGEFGGPKTLYQEGSKYVNQALADKETNSMLVAARGLLAMYGSSNTNEARKILEDGLKENSNSAVLHTALGYVLLKKGELGEARDHLMEGAKQSDIRALVGLGLYAMRRTMYREATQAFHRALQSDRGHVESTLYMGILALLWGDSPGRRKVAHDMLKHFNEEMKASASDKEKAYAELIDTVLKVRNRKTRKAGLTKLETLMKAHGGDALFQFVGAKELRRRHKLKQAKQAIEKALRLDGSRPDFALEEASIYLALKDYEGTRSRAMRVQEMDAESGQASILIGEAYLGEKNFPKAEQYFKEATKFDDTEALSHLRLGDAYMGQTTPDADRAQAQYELAVPGLRTSGEGHLAAVTCVKLAKIYASKNRHKEFLNILQIAIKSDGSYAPPYCMIATNIDIGTKDGRDQAKEYCGNCVKFDTGGKSSGRCREMLKKLR